MRRSEKEITDRDEMEAIIRAAGHCQLALVDGAGPYIVTMHHAWDDRSLWLHAAREGRKIEVLKRNPRVCFTMVTEAALVPGETACAWGTRYRSVVGTGTAVLVESPEEKKRGLDLLLQHLGVPASGYPEAMLARVAVIRIDVIELTGKRSG